MRQILLITWGHNVFNNEKLHRDLIFETSNSFESDVLIICEDPTTERTFSTYPKSPQLPVCVKLNENT